MEIYVGSTNPVKHKIFWRGEATDADSNPTVAVYDVSNDPETTINPLTPLYSGLTTQKSETDIGVYSLNLPVDATYKARDFRLVWSYNVQGNFQSRQHKLFVVQPYADHAQVYDYLRIGNDPSDPNYRSYEEIVSAERYARKVIENYTGQKFYNYPDVCSVY